MPQTTIWRSNGEYTKNHNIILLLFMLKVTEKIYYRFFVTCRKHRFIELANLQIPKNVDLSKSMNRKKVIEPSIVNYEKNIGCPPLINTTTLFSIIIFVLITVNLNFILFQFVLQEALPGVSGLLQKSAAGANRADLSLQQVNQSPYF